MKEGFCTLFLLLFLLPCLASSNEHLDRNAKNIFGVADEEGISIWNGRIILTDKTTSPSNTKNDKKIKICLTSDGDFGICSKLTACPGFRLSRLRNNICRVSSYVPGVCCSLASALSMFLPSPESPINNNDNDRVEIITKDDKNFTCGRPSLTSSRIFGGKGSLSSDWPWMAAIYFNSFISRSFHCGGSLVTPQHVLTGAHCVKDTRSKTFSPEQISVRLGDKDLRTLRDTNEDSKFYSVRDIRAHPKFKNINQYFLNDVAILKLSREVVASSNVLPVCLPTQALMNKPLDYFHGRFSSVIGFGITEKGVPSKRLMEAKVPIWTNNECDRAYFAPITEKFICAGHPQGGIDACQGDSGGPLQILEDGHWVQIGITSFGKGCGEAGYPGVYTRLTSFLPWIEDKISY